MLHATEAIYIHIPFCVQKCNYCDFLSFPGETHMEAYINGLRGEIALAARKYPVKPRSIFMGGGTPSILPEELLEALLQTIAQYWVTDALWEYTVECNPGTVTREKFRLMKRYGVNRISFGVQSDHAEQLKLLGRIHSFEEAVEAVAMAREAGFDNLNLDFIYGIPGQSPADWQHTLESALQLSPEHISCYQLNIEEKTPLYTWLEQGIIREFDDDLALEMYRLTQGTLSAAGYHQYEISNYAKEHRESIHNKTYWQTENYLAVGLGACSWIRPHRWNNVTDIANYLAAVEAGKLPVGEEETLTVKEQMEETVFMALRMNDGLEERIFRQRFGTSVEKIFPDALKYCLQKNWITKTPRGYALTETGRVLGNLVFEEFIL